ncbi:MAG TPA: alpha/beta hydrolase-fold protein [Fimbriiglobus sp.]|nr:alpha/beta hydrolase-fold protein [Fimbriiglobus sp.]
MLPGWSRESVGGKPADVFHPPRDERPRAAVLFLHVHSDALQLPSDNAAYTAELARHGLACCAPHGMRSWWADRVCPEFDPTLTAERHLLDNVRPWMSDRWHLPPRAVAAVGISMGGQGAVRLGFKYPDLFPVVASVAGAFDYHELYGQGLPLDEMYESRERCRLDTAVLHINPNRYPPHVWFACDPADTIWYRGNDRLDEKLSALGIPHVADLETSAGGHSWAYFDRMAGPMLAFVAEALRTESRRLV